METATIIELPGGKLAYQLDAPESGEPIMRRWIWPLIDLHIEGMRGARLEDAIGRPATCRGGHVSCYLGDGAYFRARMPDLGSTPALSITDAPVPRPKVRAGIEVRWRYRWEKFSKKERAWIAA